MRDDDVLGVVPNTVEVLDRDRLPASGRAHGRPGRVEGDDLPGPIGVCRLDLYPKSTAGPLDPEAADGPGLGHVPHLGRRGKPSEGRLEATGLPAGRGKGQVADRTRLGGALENGLDPVEPRLRSRVAPRGAERHGERAHSGHRAREERRFSEVVVVFGREAHGRRADRIDGPAADRHRHGHPRVGSRGHACPVNDFRGGRERWRDRVEDRDSRPVRGDLRAEPVEPRPTVVPLDVREVALVEVPVLDGVEYGRIRPVGEGGIPETTWGWRVGPDEVIAGLRKRVDVVAPRTLTRYPVPPRRPLGVEQQRPVTDQGGHLHEVGRPRRRVGCRQDPPAVPVHLNGPDRPVLHAQ